MWEIGRCSHRLLIRSSDLWHAESTHGVRSSMFLFLFDFCESVCESSVFEFGCRRDLLSVRRSYGYYTLSKLDVVFC